jgi:hypothetical protein
LLFALRRIGAGNPGSSNLQQYGLVLLGGSVGQTPRFRRLLAKARRIIFHDSRLS